MRQGEGLSQLSRPLFAAASRLGQDGAATLIRDAVKQDQFGPVSILLGEVHGLVVKFDQKRPKNREFQ